MRFIVALVLGGALALVGCGDDNGSGGGGGSSGSGEAPVITMVEWDTAADCTAGTGSAYVITVTAEDAETPSEDLTYTGSVTGCPGAIDDVTSTVDCPNAAPYGGMTVVTDDEGNSDTVSFTIGVCDQDQSCTTDPDTCTTF